MLRTPLALLFALLLITGCADSTSQESVAPAEQPIAIVIHGGAGTITRAAMTPEREAEYRAALEAALEAGYGILESGGASLDAVIAAIQVMEESELFNAGRGAVFTSEATVEHDAAIMDGGSRNAGAVAGLKHIKSPIALARSVMEQSEHVMMIGEGAETFAREQGLEFVENTYFHTERRLEALRRAQSSATSMLDYSEHAEKYGTVGAVALDRSGNIVAGTSTGGMTNKRFGRVGDVPIIGAGTYADNETAGVSATGWGEYFIRGVVSYDIAAQMRYAEKSLDDASQDVIMNRLENLGGSGGVIALDRAGNIATPFNSEGMYRGWVDAAGNRLTAIYGDEPISAVAGQ